MLVAIAMTVTMLVAIAMTVTMLVAIAVLTTALTTAAATVMFVPFTFMTATVAISVSITMAISVSISMAISVTISILGSLLGCCGSLRLEPLLKLLIRDIRGRFVNLEHELRPDLRREENDRLDVRTALLLTSQLSNRDVGLLAGGCFPPLEALVALIFGEHLLESSRERNDDFAFFVFFAFVSGQFEHTYAWEQEEAESNLV